jgi:hypothetical protein
MIKGCGEGIYIDKYYIKKDNEKGDVLGYAVKADSLSKSLSNKQ